MAPVAMPPGRIRCGCSTPRSPPRHSPTRPGRRPRTARRRPSPHQRPRTAPCCPSRGRRPRTARWVARTQAWQRPGTIPGHAGAESSVSADGPGPAPAAPHRRPANRPAATQQALTPQPTPGHRRLQPPRRAAGRCGSPSKPACVVRCAGRTLEFRLQDLFDPLALSSRDADLASRDADLARFAPAFPRQNAQDHGLHKAKPAQDLLMLTRPAPGSRRTSPAPCPWRPAPRPPHIPACPGP